LQDHATRLLHEGSELTGWLREAQATGQAAQADSRMRDALPVVLKAIDLSLSGLDKLPDGQSAGAYERAQWIDALTTVQRLPWESLLTDPGRNQDTGTACAVNDVRSSLDQLAESANPNQAAVKHARAQLLELRAQVAVAQRHTGKPLPVAWLTGVVGALARIVRIIAIGLLAAAATAATKGGDSTSELLAAAVGLAVSAVSAEVGGAARSRWDPPTVATRLDGVHHRLLHAVNDLSPFLERLASGFSPTKDDLQLARKTEFAALTDAYQAKVLATALDWPNAPKYMASVDQVSDLLGQISSGTDAGHHSPALAASLEDAAEELARFSIPLDARIHHLAPESLRGRKDRPRR